MSINPYEVCRTSDIPSKFEVEREDTSRVPVPASESAEEADANVEVHFTSKETVHTDYEGNKRLFDCVKEEGFILNRSELSKLADQLAGYGQPSDFLRVGNTYIPKANILRVNIYPEE